jgi:phage N-6-adenine-methyltransferase
MDWATPPEVLERLYDVVGGRFDLDPCSPGKARSRVRARTHYTEQDDGLSLPWHGAVFMNPPYGGRITAWTAKARVEAAAGHAACVFGLVPARTDTRWWHRDVAGIAHVWLLRGRLAFGDGTQSAPFPSALILWGGDHELARRIAGAFPDAQHVPRRVPVSVGVAAE